jgi:hypothetical protein
MKEEITLDKAYVVARMEELTKHPIMQEYIYLQNKLKASEGAVPPEGKPEE